MKIIKILLSVIVWIIGGFSAYTLIADKQIIMLPFWVYHVAMIFSLVYIIENIRGYCIKLQEYLKRINKKCRATCADWFKKWSCKFIAWSNKIKCSDKESKFHQQYLIPAEEEDDVYSQLLWEAICDKDVQNIAITGPYGSGKSSVIRAFQKRHPEYKYLNLSLANFQEQKDTPIPPKASGSEKLSAEESQLVEVSILQQMFYQVKRKRIPDSRFKRINRLSGWTSWLWTLLVCFWFLSLFVVKKVDWFNYSWQSIDVVNVIILLSFIAGIVIVLRYVVRLVNRSHFKAFKVEKCGMEISGGTEVSILNKHLDEILYYFEVTKFNIVIIEDLDRFERCSIFTKLRELNALINKSEDINRRVVFIYAIKDDMFKDKDRTKFFDYILPIIPYINKSNSAGKFIELVEKAGFLEEGEKAFLEEISIFIDDMRLLNNIFNEYEVYRNKLNRIINNNKLLAIIVYKNTCPQDFSDLHFGNSVINRIFDQKEKIIEKKKEEIHKKIDDLKEQLQRAKEEHLANEKELRMLVLGRLKMKYPNINRFYNNSTYIGLEQLLDEKAFESLIDDEFKRYEALNGTLSAYSISFSELEKSISSDFSYKKRLTILQNRLKVYSGNIKSQIEKYTQEINSLSGCTYAELADEITLNGNGEKREVEENKKLLKFLLINGHIDENYYYYISFFHPGDITPEDREFIEELKSGNEKPYTYRLFEKESIVKKLSLSDFSRKGIINLDLLEFLLSNKREYTEKTNAFLRQLRAKKQLSFINEFVSRGKHAEELIDWLCRHWEGFWKYLLSDGNLSEEKEKEYWITMFNLVDEESINKQNLGGEMTLYINQLTDFLGLIQRINDQDKLCNLIDSLNISIEEMDEPTNEKVYRHLLKGHHYAINFHNISLILHREVPDIAENDIKTRNYTTIINSGCVDLTEYIKADINSYVEKINLETDACSYESEENFVLLLNNETLKIENKRLLIERYCRVIKDFNDIEDNTLWTLLLQRELVEKTWKNVSVYWEHYGLDGALIDFLNKKEVMDSLIVSDSDDLTEEFVMEFVGNNKIDYNTFKTYLDSDCPKHIPTDITEMAESKVLYLIKNNMFDMNVDNYEILKDSFPEISFALIENNWEEYLAEYNEYELSDTDFIKALKSSDIENTDKIKIIKQLDIQKAENNLNLCKVIAAILAEYSEWDEMDEDLIEIILQKDIPMKNKVMIIVHRIENSEIKEDTLEVYLNLLGTPYSELYQSRKEKELDMTSFNEKLIECLKAKKIVRKYVSENGQFKVSTRWR